MIIRVNSNNLFEMRNAVVATLYHCTAFKSEDHVTCIVQKEKIAGINGSQTKKQVKKLKNKK